MKKPSEIYNDARNTAISDPGLGIPHLYALEVLATTAREDERKKIHSKLIKRTR